MTLLVPDLPEDSAARQARNAALIGATIWTVFFAFAVLVDAGGYLIFPQIGQMAVVFAFAVGANIVLAATSPGWIGWSAGVYAYEAINAAFVTLLLAYIGGSTELGIVFVAYGFFVIHTAMIRPDASPFATANLCGIAYASLAAAEASGWVTPTPVLHDPLRVGERVVPAVFGVLALNALAFYASRFAAERRRLTEHLEVLVVERTRALADANIELVAKAKALETSKQENLEFFYTVTHDIKGPVSNVVLLSDLVLEVADSVGSEVRRRLERIAANASRAENMLMELWRFLTITEKVEPPGWCNLAGIVKGTLESLAAQIAQKDTRVVANGLPEVWGGKDKLGHVFSNLLSNAVKYAPDRGGLIEVTARVETAEVWIFVRDDGIGIAEEFHERIFDLFGQAPSDGAVAARDRGTGVGLAIVKRIVAEHHGAVGVWSTPGEGSCFWLRLPHPATADGSGRPHDEAR